MRVLIFTCLLVLGGVIHPFSALGYRVNDFRVNDSIPPSELEQIVIATDYKGKFVVGWEDLSEYLVNHIGYYKLFRLDGSQVGSQVRTPDVIEQGQKLLSGTPLPVLLPNGNVVTLRGMRKDSVDSQGNTFDFLRNYLDIFDSLGNLLVPTYLAETTALYPAGLKADKDGNFTIVMYRTLNDSLNETYYKQFYPDGQIRRGLTKVECGSLSGCDFEQQTQALSMNPQGRFIISWDAMHSQVPIAAIYNADGTSAKDPLILSCEDTLNTPCVVPGVHCLSASAPKVGIDSAGNFMAAYNACVHDPTGKPIVARLFDSLGNPQTPNLLYIQELQYTFFYFHRPHVVATEDGEFIVIWVDKSLEIPENKPYGDIWAKRFSATGQQIGIKYRINNSVGSVLSAELFDAAVCNGHLIVAWFDKRSRPALYNSVYAQIMPVDEVGVFTPGDINYDYNIDLADLITMVNYVFKGADPPEGSPLVADVNGDCKVNLADIIYFVNYLFKAGAKPLTGCAK